MTNRHPGVSGWIMTGTGRPSERKIDEIQVALEMAQQSIPSSGRLQGVVGLSA
jgi:hypothetical protein